jgi:hypothetical protein
MRGIVIAVMVVSGLGGGVVKLRWQLWWWWCVVIRCCWFRWGLFEGVLAVVVVVVG